MDKSYIIYLGIFLFCANINGQVQEMCDPNDTDVMEGEYTSIHERQGISLKPEYQLDQNYPNPFNEATRMSYLLSRTAFVTVKIYDIYGREIQTLINKLQQPGNYYVNFHAQDLPGGIYTCRLYLDNELADTRKMILVNFY